MRKADEKKQELRKAVRIRRHMPVRAWIAEWMTTYKEPNVSEKTYQDYKYIMAHVDIDMPLAEVKPIHLQRILNDQAGKSTSFLRKLNLLMRECFEAAVDNELIPANPARKLTLPKGYTGKRRALTAEEKKLVLKVAKTHRAGTWVLLMLLCGMRPSEAAKIQGRDVDFQSMRIHVRGTKTASADRFVPLPARLKDSLSGLEPFEYAVKDTRGNPTTPTSRRTMWASFMKAVQIAAGARTEREKHASVPHLVGPLPIDPSITPYWLRHTYATDLEAAGVPINVARDLLGHADITVTSKIYTHRSEEAFQSAAEKINAFQQVM